MKPDVGRFLEVAAAHLMTRTAPAVTDGYEQSSAGILGVLLVAVREEFERAAARRVEENAALRGLFAAAAPAVTDPALAQRLQRAAEQKDSGLLVSHLERDNAGLRGLLIDLHVHVEEADSPAASEVEAAIWRELAASTERRRLSLGVF